MPKSITRRALLQTRRERDKRLARSRDALHAATAENEGITLRTAGEPLSLVAADAALPDALPSFSATAYTGGVMYPKLAIAWNGPVVIDLAGLDCVATNPIHRDHDESKPVGHSTAVANTGTRLDCSGVFSVPSDDSREIIDGARNGFPWRPSVGVKMLRYTTVSAGQSCQANGRTFDGPVLLVTRSILKEISLVTIPGDDSATISIAASADYTNMTFEDYVASLGLDPSTLSEQLKTALSVSWAEATKPDETPAPVPHGMDAGGAASPPPAPPATASAQDYAKPMAHSSSPSPDLTAGNDINAFRAQLAAETARANEVRTLCAKFGSQTVMVGGKNVDLAAHAIEHGWTADQCELAARRQADLEAKRDDRPRGPAIHSHNSISGVSLQALQAGMLLRAGTKLDSDKFDNADVKRKLPGWLQAGINDSGRQQVMEQGYNFRDISLTDACRLSLVASGHDAPHNRIDMIRAAFSSGSAGALFGATIGAKLLEAYAEIADFSVSWCSEDENPDLEQHNRNRLQAASNLEYHPIGGEAPHAGRNVITEKTQVNRFTRQIQLDEADVWGDNFGALKDSPRDFGLAAGRVRPDLVATVLLANGNLLTTGRALFNTTDGNMTASGKALARATLSEMIGLMAKRKDGDATLDLPLNVLIVPPELSDTAVQLCYSANLSNDSGSGDMNPLKKYGIDVISEPRLSNGMVHPITKASLSGSATQYYGVSKTGRTLEVTYLVGAGRVPVVRTENLTGGNFGIVTDVRHYIGVSPLDWRPFHRFSA